MTAFKPSLFVAALGLALGVAGCSPKPPAATSAAPAAPNPAPAPATADLPPPNPENNAYFGDCPCAHRLVVRRASPTAPRPRRSDAYAWAQGKAITGSGGPEMQIKTPLDFYMVSDHAEFMGVFNQMANPDSPLSKTELAKGVTSPDANVRMQTFAGILRDMSAGKRDPQLSDPALARTVWAEIVKAADANYVPGKFTTFAGFEWTSNPKKRNLHRVVVFRDTAKLPDMVLSALDSDDPEMLWKWMDEQRAKGSTLFAIPHNGNASDGRMFDLVKFDGKPIDAAYNKTRAANEPLYEITQIKGTSETHPELSPTDEFAGFELWDYTLSADFERPTHAQGQLRPPGPARRPEPGGQPAPAIRSSTASSATPTRTMPRPANEEFNYTGKFAFENNAKERLTGIPGAPAGQIQQIQEFSSGGLAGVWAPQNTREAIWDAMQRKETFGTSGPMMKVRFFGSFDYAADDVKQARLRQARLCQGRADGRRPEARRRGKAPTFLVMALKDPKSGNLDRIQIVKGWLDAAGKQHEKIYDVVWSGDRKIGADGKLPAVGNTVDLKTATYTNDIGAAQLATGWTDPDFKPGERAFYYARVLEIPTPRWNTYDAARQNMPPLTKVPATIQERAWSSPIWYTPS